MIDNIHPRDELTGLARSRRNPNQFLTVSKTRVEDMQAAGWELAKRNKHSVRLKKPKTRDVMLEDRIWTLCFGMGFDYLSGKGGAKLAARKDSSAPRQLDAVAIDDDVALVFECKSALTPTKSRNVKNYIDTIAANREAFATAVKNHVPTDGKRHTLLILALWDVILSDKDRQRADDMNVVVLEEPDLRYFEELLAHLGPAARFQFLASLAPGKSVEGLKTRVPAIRSKTGNVTSYMFSVRADYLLKIAYVSHRARGSVLNVDTYQRMIRKNRIRNIQKYIDKGGTFPTNIVLNISKGRGEIFERGKDVGDDEGATNGFLTLTPAYGSAWVIDGQHRLFAYSGMEQARTSYLHVLAFENLAPSEQARLFIDINHEQKSVKRSLLQELYAELRWDASDPTERVSAVISKCVQALGGEPESPLYGRVLLADDKSTGQRCISLNSLYSAIDQPGMFVVKEGVTYGPLWASTNDEMLARCIRIVGGWLQTIASRVPDWWELGREQGGGLAMNDGVTILLGVLRIVCAEEERMKGTYLAGLTNDELWTVLEQYGGWVGDHLRSWDDGERESFRRGARGVQGQTAQRVKLLGAINAKDPDFEPEELTRFRETQDSGARDEAYRIISEIELALKRYLLEGLKEGFAGDDDEAWWHEGVPEKVRLKASERREKDRAEKGDASAYLDLVDFREIGTANWGLFGDVIGDDGGGNKDKRTRWLASVNKIRNVVMHPASEAAVSPEQLEELERVREWLLKSIQTDAEGSTES